MGHHSQRLEPKPKRLALGTMPLNPLPFRLSPTGRDTLAFEGIESVSYRFDGFLRLADQSVTLEWSGTRTTEQVSLDKIGTDVDEFPLEWLELPFRRLAAAWVIGGLVVAAVRIASAWGRGFRSSAGGARHHTSPEDSPAGPRFGPGDCVGD